MNTEFKTYLISMGLDSEVTLKNADKILGIASKLCPEEIKDIFISEFRKDNGSREYESMWLFSDNFILEVRNFRSEIDIDMSNNKPIVYFRVQMKGFDYENDPGELARSAQPPHELPVEGPEYRRWAYRLPDH